MWLRFVQLLACPICDHDLEIYPFRVTSVQISDDHGRLASQLGVLDEQFNVRVEAGTLVCNQCRKWFPIAHGLPVLVPYTTPLHQSFAAEFEKELNRMGPNYDFPGLEPVIGEQFVMKSFSREWLNYDYDGVIWDLSYEDREEMFLAEVGVHNVRAHAHFVEIGCGLGLTTYFGHKHFQGDAIGVDLSLAVMRAVGHFRDNPFLHFVQGSAFYVPLKKQIADVMYSHGVLHHTYSTRDAFRALAPYCRPNGLIYVWLYGTGSQKGSLLRRLTYHTEELARPLVSRHLDSRFSKAFLSVLSGGYMVVNAFHRLRNPEVGKYDFKKALHAARDRFTPLYAHRQDYPEVAEWFREAGFQQIEQVDWRAMPSANRDNYRRNTGVRGRRVAS